MYRGRHHKTILTALAAIGGFSLAIGLPLALDRHPASIPIRPVDAVVAEAPQCAQGYRPQTGYDLDVCISASGSTVTPSMTVNAVGDTGGACSVVLEVWDDAGNRLDGGTPADTVPCAPGSHSGTPLNLAGLPNVTAHTTPDGSLTVHAFARLRIDGQAVYRAGEGDSPTVTVPAAGAAAGAAPSAAAASCAPTNHSGNPCEASGAQAQQEHVITATLIGTRDPFTVVDTDAGFSLCSVGTVQVTCTGTPPWGVLNQPLESYVAAVAKYSAQAGVDPRLVLGILKNESNRIHGAVSDQLVDPTVDGALCAVTHSSGCAGPSLGIADMKQDTFNQVQANHSDLFASAQWGDLTSNSDLAIQTLTWELHDLARGLPGTAIGGYTAEQVLGMAYNGGTQLALDYAGGGTDLSSDTRTKLQFYADGISQYWSTANQLFCQSGAFTCTG